MLFMNLRKIFHQHRPFFLSQTNFILRVAPLRRHQKGKKTYFPPPGYGVPASKKTQFEHSPQQLAKITKVAEYGFYLTPSKLARDYFFISLLLALIIFSPLVSVHLGEDDPNPVWWMYYGIAIVSYLIIIGVFYFVIYRYFMPPVLTNIWPLWPEPSYRLLQSVPHKVKLADNDQALESDSLYWSPKPQRSLFRQPQEYAKETPTLQNVLLDFAIFELFFFSKPKLLNFNHYGVSDEAKSTTSRNELIWFYWLSPVFVNYFMLLLMLPIAWFTLTNIPAECFFIEPKQSLSLALITWAIVTYWFIKARLLGRLERLKEKVEQEYFVCHLDLVPQQILKHIEGIPEAKHIKNYIADIENLLNWMLGFSAVIYIGIIDGSF